MDTIKYAEDICHFITNDLAACSQTHPPVTRNVMKGLNCTIISLHRKKLTRTAVGWGCHLASYMYQKTKKIQTYIFFVVQKE